MALPHHYSLSLHSLSLSLVPTRTGCSDGFMVNLSGVMLRFCRPFVSGYLEGGPAGKFGDLFQKHLDPEYFAGQAARLGDLSKATVLAGGEHGRSGGKAGRGEEARLGERGRECKASRLRLPILNTSALQPSNPSSPFKPRQASAAWQLALPPAPLPPPPACSGRGWRAAPRSWPTASSSRTSC